MIDQVVFTDNGSKDLKLKKEILQLKAEKSLEIFIVLTPGVYFTSILFEAFTAIDPKSAKTLSSSQSFLHFWDLQV
jgi:hypothetical protein